MFENESLNNINIKKLNKFLCKTDALFLNRLYFWSSHKKSYGIEKEGRVWIYNTLEDWSSQLGISKSSVRRAIKSLKEKGSIDSNYLAINKRDRTLYYSINFKKINEYLSKISIAPCVHINNINTHKNTSNEHMDEHMYIDNNKQNINKSYKSKNKKKLEDENCFSETNDKLMAQKPKIVQDMIEIWKEEFASTNIKLTKNLARFLVAAFKSKFKSCLKEWRKYLKTLKTSAYIMSEKFKISIWWVIKFITIDRIRAGELGIKEIKIQQDNCEIEQKAIEHIESVDEPEFCKEFRKKIMKILSPAVYVSWFSRVEIVEILNEIRLKTDNRFVRSYIERSFLSNLNIEFVN